MIRTDNNYYIILQVDPHAEQEVITAAYQVLKQKYQSIKDSSEETDQKIRLIEDAYQILSDTTKRAHYDSVLWDE